MDLRALTDSFFVAPQIDPADMTQIAAAGIKTIICNRPDAEIPPSHHAMQMEVAAKQAGLAFHILPLTHQTLTPVTGQQQVELGKEDAPVLAYCASGTRSTMAWAIGSAMENVPVDDILKAAQNAGYDLESWRAPLEQLASSDS